MITKVSYRNEIDGLRALAIIPVIIYHLNISLFDKGILSGGYLGVDIFFVISGYVITNLILHDLLINKKFSLINFFERRIRRLLPVLITVILFAYIFFYIFFLPDDFINFSKSTYYSLFFTSNIFFHYLGFDYFITKKEILPLLHTWSLSVEEQFYIFFPIGLIIIYKFSNTLFLKNLFLALISFFLISFLFSNWAKDNHISFNYYMIFSRGWELLSGCILAYLNFISLGNKIKKKLNSNESDLICLFFLIIIILCLFFFNNQTPHPSYYTFIPVFSVFIIILFSENSHHFKKMAKNKILIFVGLISYSLYVWHYPIFALFNYLELSSLFDKFIALIITFGLSVITYFTIERPFRNKKIKFTPILIFISFSLVIILFFKSNFFTNNYIYKKKEFHNLVKNNYTIINNCDSLKECNFIKKNSKKNIVFIGDSLLIPIANSFTDKYNNVYNINSTIISGCPFLLNTIVVNKLNKGIRGNCSEQINIKRFEFLEKFENTIFIYLGNFLQLYEETFLNNSNNKIKFEITPAEIQNFNKKLNLFEERNIFFKNNFDETILFLTKKNNKLILLYPFPEIGFDVNKKIHIDKKINYFRFKKEPTKEYFVNLSDFKKSSQNIFNIFDSIKKDNVYKLYTHMNLCDIEKNKCFANKGLNVFYQDQIHLNLKSAKLISDDLNKLILNLIKK